MKRISIIFACIAFCAACVFCLDACSSSSSQSDSASNTDGAAAGTTGASTTSIVIGTLATEDILPMWVAEAEGLFEEEGLSTSVQVFQSATELIAGVSAGEVDFAMTDPMVTASLYASGSDVQITWVTLGLTADQGRFGIMTADSSIKSLQDLRGKSIGVGSNTILEYVMDKLIEDAGIEAGAIGKEELQKLPVRYESMASGQVTAAALPASLLALGEANGFVCIADDTQGENISQSVMIAQSEVIAGEEGSALNEALARVWDKAVNLINENPENYRSLLVEKASLPEAVAQTYKICTYPTAQLPEQEMIDPILDWMLEKGYLESAISYDAKTGTFSGR